MKKLIKILALSAATAVLCISFGACSSTKSGDNTQSNANTKTIIVGFDQSFPPMGFKDVDGQYKGFDIDLAKAAGQILHVNMKFQPINWDSASLELSNKKVDCLWNGVSITPDRQKVWLFTKPYMQNEQVIIVPPNSPIKTPADLAGKKIALQRGSSAMDALKKNPVYSKIGSSNIMQLDDNVAVLLAVKTGKVDAAAMDSTFANYEIKKDNDNLIVLKQALGTEDFAVAFSQDNVVLEKSIDSAIAQLVDNGTAKKISMQWFGTNVFANYGKSPTKSAKPSPQGS